MGKVKVIIKRPDEKYGHVCSISTTLKNLQKTVGGYIEVVPLTDTDVLICNEEGKPLQLPINFRLYGDTPYADTVRGTVIVVGTEGDDFADLKMGFATWKKLIDKWEG